MMEKRIAMSEQASEGRLIEACRQGDREAFQRLFETYQSRVWSIALHFTGDEAGARDITQEVFLKLFTTIAQFRHDASFGTWLYRLVVNACLDEQRRRSRLISFDFLRWSDDAEDDAGEVKAMGWRQPLSAEERCAQFEISGKVKAAVRELKPKLRMVILLKHFGGFSYEEMAQVLGCSTGTIASRLNRGHRELARRLAYLQGK